VEAMASANAIKKQEAKLHRRSRSSGVNNPNYVQNDDSDSMGSYESITSDDSPLINNVRKLKLIVFWIKNILIFY
jgi:hypothetical protein